MNFEQASARLLGHEGGYVNDPNDPGGETNWGISKRSYPNVDIKALTRDEALAIYKRDYWDRVRADQMPEALRFQVYDFAVNSGIETAIRYYQRALGVADDGHWGAVSRTASQTMPVTDQLFRLNAERLDFMTRLSNWPHASRGWARRIVANLRFSAEDS